jgi:hypothetical protein
MASLMHEQAGLVHVPGLSDRLQHAHVTIGSSSISFIYHFCIIHRIIIIHIML